MDDVPWLDSAERRTWLALLATTSRLDDALDRQLQRDAGMPLAYYQLLAMLSEAPGRSMRMTDLAEITQSSQSRISHAVKRLEARSWVVRTPVPGRPAQHPGRAHRRRVLARSSRPRPGTCARCGSTCSTR